MSTICNHNSVHEDVFCCCTLFSQSNCDNICYIRIAENLGVHDPNLFEGDMILTPEQRLEAEMGLDVDSSLKRGSVSNRLWPDGMVAYEIQPDLGKFFINIYVLYSDFKFVSCSKLEPYSQV